MNFVYKVVAFIYDNWKKPIKALVAVYMIVMGVSYFMGTTLLGGLPMINLTIPGIAA